MERAGRRRACVLTRTSSEFIRAVKRRLSAGTTSADRSADCSALKVARSAEVGVVAFERDCLFPRSQLWQLVFARRFGGAAPPPCTLTPTAGECADD